MFIYHFPCIDGAYACLCASQYFTSRYPSVSQSFLPFKLDRRDLIDFTGCDAVFFLDILPEHLLEPAIRQVGLVVVIDHHLTNSKILDHYQNRTEGTPNLVVNFDLEYSAAKLAYLRYESVIRNDRLSTVIDYVEDSDIWRWRLPDSLAVSCFMQETV